MKLSIVAILFGIALGRPGEGPYQEAERPDYIWNKEHTTSELKNMDKKLMWAAWKNHFDKSYSDLAEEALRYEIWNDNIELIGEVNSQELSYKLRANQFTDLTRDEFKLHIHGHMGSCMQRPPLEDELQSIDLSELNLPVDAPASVDWEAAGDVTPVKNQGQCGSCWAFASTGCIECDYAIKNGKLNSLSEQQLVDCTRNYGNYGCNGGWWYNAFDYVIKEGGLCSESEYPYTARDGTCKDTTCGTKYDPITASIKITPDNEAALESGVANGCVAVGVEADQTAWQHYSSGILTGTCGTNIDHGVLAVGYGTSGSQEYWKVKNSWGTSWGDKGYIYVCKDCNKNGQKGECGIRMYPYMVTAGN